MPNQPFSFSRTERPVWPEGRQSAVALAFDVDGPTGDAMLDGSLRDNPRYFTQGAYGPWKALPRLLDLLATYNLRATFFVPTWVVLHWTAHCRRIVDDGHEIAYHGHRHEVFIDCTPQHQLEIMERSRTIFQDLLGVTPQGFRTPSGDWSRETAQLLGDFGVLYSSSMRGDDRPYFHPASAAGQGLVEIPGRWDIDDYTALAYTEEPDFPTGLDRISDYRAVAGNWCAEFEGYHRDGLCWTTILHPKVCARPGRLAILEEVFRAITRHGDAVWSARCIDVAQWWIAQHSGVAKGVQTA